MRSQIANPPAKLPGGLSRAILLPCSDGAREFKDEVGRTFSTVEAAKGHAAIVASELALDHNWDSYVVCVR
jgi:hypothetical protein